MCFLSGESMKTAYDVPVALILKYDEYDVITTSGEGDGGGGGEAPGGGNDWTGEWDTDF